MKSTTLIALLTVTICFDFRAVGFTATTSQRATRPQTPSVVEDSALEGRRSFIGFCTSVFLVGTLPSPSHAFPEQKSYSANARNLDRLSVGDQSGGSIYDNNPKNPTAAKRRAMLGCKVPVARKEAGMASEKECNFKVMDGGTEFMLKTLRKLDCPTCPYGIKGA